MYSTVGPCADVVVTGFDAGVVYVQQHPMVGGGREECVIYYLPMRVSRVTLAVVVIKIRV